MTQPTTKELIESLTTQHMEFYRKNPRGQLAQTCLIFGEDGDVVAVECGWQDAATRQMTIATLRAMMVTYNAIRYAVWSEVWMAMQKVPPGVDPGAEALDALADYQVGDISRDPDRIEAVFTLVVEASGARAHRLQKIIRGRSGGVRTLIHMEPMDGMGGALSDLLPKRTFN